MSQDGRWAVGRDTRGYISDYKRPAADIYRVNTVHRRAHADRSRISSPASTCSASRPTATTSSTGRTTSSRRTTSTPATTKTLGGASARELRRRRVRSSGPEAVVRHQRATRPTARRSIATHRYDLWLVPLDGSAPTQPHERRRHQERDPLPLRADRARFERRRWPRRADRRRSRRWSRRQPRRSISSKPVTLSAYGEWTKKAGFYELAERPAEGARLRGRVVHQPDEGREGRRVPLHAADVHRVPRPARVGARISRTRRRSATPTRSRPSTCGDTASCSTSRTTTATSCRASSRFRTTTSRARSGRCS